MLKDIVRKESARLKLRSFSGDGQNAFTLALALSAAVKKVFYEKSETTFSGEPEIEKKPIVEFNGRMRVDAMEKFNTTTVFSVIQLASSEDGLRKQEYLITLVFYLDKDSLPDFLRLLQYPYIDADEDLEVKDGCGTLGNVIAGQYKKEMASLGYRDASMSHFESYINTAVNGIAIPRGTTEKYQVTFEVDGTKRLVVELISFAMLPRWQAVEKALPKKILVIDDDPAFLKSIEAFLEAHGFSVLVARDGKEGIEQLRRIPQLIILDLNMPHLDGFGFILKMKETPIGGVVQPPIIVLTSREDVSDIMKVEGIVAYMTKPFQPDELLNGIQMFI